MKFAVLIVALTTQCVTAKLRNEYGYFDEKFCVLKWITYLKRLSLIALILCSVVLYYMPKSRSYARIVCCALIDFVANGLKFVVNITETEYGYKNIKARDENDLNEEPRVQELYRKACGKDTNIYGRRHVNKINIDDHRSMRKQERRKFHTKRNAGERHTRHQRQNHHNRNAVVKSIPPKSGAMITSIVDSVWQKVIMDEKFKKDNVTSLQESSPKTRVAICNMSVNKLKNNVDLRPEGAIKDHENSTAKDIEIESLYDKMDSSVVPQIINESDIEYELMYENRDNQYRNYVKNNLPIIKDSENLERTNSVRSVNKEFRTIAHITLQQQEMDISNICMDKSLQDRHNFDGMKHEEIANTFQHQSSEHHATSIMKKQIADPRYGRVFTKHELYDERRRENHQFLYDLENIAHDCYENAPIITNRAKPTLSRIINWLFGGCPEASRRRPEQVDEVGKEEILESTNT